MKTSVFFLILTGAIISQLKAQVLSEEFEGFKVFVADKVLLTDAGSEYYLPFEIEGESYYLDKTPEFHLYDLPEGISHDFISYEVYQNIYSIKFVIADSLEAKAYKLRFFVVIGGNSVKTELKLRLN